MIKPRKHITGLLILLSAFFSVSGQDIKITSVFDSSRIYIGDQIGFTVTIDKPEGLNLQLPLFKDTIIKSIEIISGPKTDSSRENGRMRVIQKYLITSFDSGRYQVPPVFAELRNENGLKRFYSDYSVLEVLRTRIAPADTASKIFDIIRPYRAPLTVGEILPWALIAIVIATIVWFGLKLLKRYKRSDREIETFVIPDPAHIIAFRELEKLREEKLWQKNEVKLYYTRVTEILRQYLDNRFRVSSLELTTRETLDALVKSGFKKDGSYTRLKNILTSADLVKFAKYTPIPEEHESIFSDSWSFVQVTKEETANEPGAPANDKPGEEKP